MECSEQVEANQEVQLTQEELSNALMDQVNLEDYDE